MQLFLSILFVAGWIAGAYLIADFITGVIHWAEDTWTAPGRSAFLDKWIVLDNLEHHRRPGSIRGGDYWTTNKPSLYLTAAIGLALAVCDVRAWQVYLVLAFASQGNQIHKWAHSADRPWLVARLQDVGIMQSRRHHGRHHSHPYAVHFCAMTDYLNPILDAAGFWRWLESLVVTLGGTRTRGTAARGGL